MICDENFKYTCYLEPDSEELFDLRTDRLEKKNLARLPEYASVLETYRQKLKEHVSRTNDDFSALPALMPLPTAIILLVSRITKD